ncbi:hypothetical protein BUPH_04758 (plasmid) [Paraburkholderia phenoliruptrix BR3459a]|uniref:Uncharacterized protein n=1 Tax=Paraburkholderia phenoliruptrix BR3459a TaxID=1229205 RepID=K0E055_9BURK|nr:hypothetical protein BUPH_04758 [Paraburkholderia phenoliruptrix BR3459a]
MRYVRRSFAPCGRIGSPRIPHHTTSDDVLERFAAHAFASRRRERLEGKSVPLKSVGVAALPEAGLEIGGQRCALHGGML